MTTRLRPPAGSTDVTAAASGIAFVGAEVLRAADLLKRCAYHGASHAVACLCLGIPLTGATIPNGARIYRGHYRPPHDAGLECMVILCLAGPIGDDDSDRTDVQMAREYLTRAGFDLLGVEREMIRLRAAAGRLVITEQRRIAAIARALLKFGTLTGEEISERSGVGSKRNRGNAFLRHQNACI